MKKKQDLYADGVLEKLDILYMTRIQKERFPTPEAYEKVKGVYILKKKDVEKMKKNAKILHPLPRVGEILEEGRCVSVCIYVSVCVCVYIFLVLLSLTLHFVT